MVLGRTVEPLNVSRQLKMLIGLGIIVAVPLAYVILNGWLADFAYRANPGPATFAAAALIALCIGWLTVGYQSLKAAMTDPVKALRYE